MFQKDLDEFIVNKPIQEVRQIIYNNTERPGDDIQLNTESGLITRITQPDFTCKKVVITYRKRQVKPMFFDWLTTYGLSNSVYMYLECIDNVSTNIKITYFSYIAQKILSIVCILLVSFLFGLLAMFHDPFSENGDIVGMIVLLCAGIVASVFVIIYFKEAPYKLLLSKIKAWFEE